MIIDKVFNNNVVQVRNDKGEEEIIMGRGLGFQKKPEDLVDDSLVEKRFTLQDSSLINDLTSVYQNLSLKEIETVTAIIEHGQEVLDTVYDMALYISLADHLHYTFERLENGLIINNPLSWEIRKFFPKNFKWRVMVLQLLKK